MKGRDPERIESEEGRKWDRNERNYNMKTCIILRRKLADE